jgi:hypothetical protein
LATFLCFLVFFHVFFDDFMPFFGFSSFFLNFVVNSG